MKKEADFEQQQKKPAQQLLRCALVERKCMPLAV